MPAGAGIGNQLFILNGAKFLEIQCGRPTLVVYHRPERTLSYGDARLLLGSEGFSSSSQVLSALILLALKTFSLLGKLRLLENLVHDGRRHDIKSLTAKPKLLIAFDYFQALTSDSYLDFQAISSLPNEEFAHKSKTVAIHCRRGDYVGNADYGIVPIENQIEAALRLLEENQNPGNIIFFTDSKRTIATELERITSLQTQTHLKIFDSKMSVEREFLTLASFSNIVISNSTFAWWAAKAGHEKKTVLYPDPWVANSDLSTPLMPKGWNAYGWDPPQSQST